MPEGALVEDGTVPVTVSSHWMNVTCIGAPGGQGHRARSSCPAVAVLPGHLADCGTRLLQIASSRVSTPACGYRCLRRPDPLRQISSPLSPRLAPDACRALTCSSAQLSYVINGVTKQQVGDESRLWKPEVRAPRAPQAAASNAVAPVDAGGQREPRRLLRSRDAGRRRLPLPPLPHLPQLTFINLIHSKEPKQNVRLVEGSTGVTVFTTYQVKVSGPAHVVSI